jgi:hypothetical protein
MLQIVCSYAKRHVFSAQVLTRTVMLSLLFATQPWWAAVYLGGDFLVLVVYKAARRDLVFWPPGFGVPISLLTRFAIKVFTDSTACVHFRQFQSRQGERAGLQMVAASDQFPEVPPRQLRVCAG